MRRHDQPCRRSSFQVPFTVQPTWNSRPISVLIRLSVHRWSSANPCASGPRLSSASSRTHCWDESRSRETGPVDFSAAVPPSRQARRHRRTDPGVTRRSRARGRRAPGAAGVPVVVRGSGLVVQGWAVSRPPAGRW